MARFPHLTGLIAAPFTPFAATGKVCLERIGDYAAHLRACGVTGAFVCGTTGESMSLTVAERMAIAERWVETAGDLAVIVHVGHTCLTDCRTLAAHAGGIGARAIGLMSPFFFKPALPELIDFCAAVAAAAPETPSYYYHIPSMTGVTINVADFLAAAGPRIPTLAGVKFTYENLMDYTNCLQVEGGAYDCLFGRDEILLASLALGAKGAVGSTYNMAAPLYLRLIDAFHRGDLDTARSLQARAIAMIQLPAQLGLPNIPAFKAMMRMLGIDCGPVRPPLRNLTEEEYIRLHAALDTLSFFTEMAI